MITVMLQKHTTLSKHKAKSHIFIIELLPEENNRSYVYWHCVITIHVFRFHPRMFGHYG